MRTEAGFTQRELAQKLKVTHVFVHKSETGERRVDVTEFLDWCVACQVNPDEAFKSLRQQRGV